MNILYTSDGCVYTGMTQEAVQGMLDAQGSNATFISEDDFNTQQAARIAARDA